MSGLVANIFNISSSVTSDENIELNLINKLVEIILRHSKENHAKQYDPFIIRGKQVIQFNEYGESVHDY